MKISSGNILITGGAGYIGARLARKLVDIGYQVSVIDNLSSGFKENLASGIPLYLEDINSPNIHAIFKRINPDYVYHLAASKSVNESISNPEKFKKNNLEGSKRIIDESLGVGVKRFIFTSTAAVYGPVNIGIPQCEDDPLSPVSPYGQTKKETEDYLLHSCLDVNPIIFRFANVYGPGGKTTYESAINLFVQRILRDQTIEIHGDGMQTRDFVFIDDLIELATRSLELDLTNRVVSPVFNISTGIATNINAVVEQISQLTSKKPKVLYRHDISYGQRDSLLSTTKTKDLFAYPNYTPLVDGIKRTIAEYL